MNTIRSSQLVLAIGFATSLFAGAVRADASASVTAERDSRSVTVRFDAAELASSAGVRAVYDRLEQAAKFACHRGVERSIAGRADELKCREEALAKAVQEIADANLAGLHRSETGGQDVDDRVASLESTVQGS